jgi:hypothetical protein
MMAGIYFQREKTSGSVNSSAFKKELDAGELYKSINVCSNALLQNLHFIKRVFLFLQKKNR